MEGFVYLFFAGVFACLQNDTIFDGGNRILRDIPGTT